MRIHFLASVMPVLFAAVRSESQCNAWGPIVTDLTRTLYGKHGCTDPVRATIRLAFHDCFSGTCDGSIISKNECWDRPENNGLEDICDTVGDLSTLHNVTTADMIQVTAALSIAVCPPGPRINIKVGRSDGQKPSPECQLPDQKDHATKLIPMFAAKGFSSKDLVALVGAHSVGKFQNRLAFDSTVDNLDSTTFYSEVLEEAGPITLPSDKSLAYNEETNPHWLEYAKDQGAWDNAFKEAMEKLSVMGVAASEVEDCTDAIFAAFDAGMSKA